jgi:putative transposase
VEDADAQTRSLRLTEVEGEDAQTRSLRLTEVEGTDARPGNGILAEEVPSKHWIYEDNYKHYRNFAAGCTVFATTTALDFAPVFAQPQTADLMTASLLNDCAFCGVKLWAFVVMPTHIHLLVTLREGQSASAFMGGAKSKAAKRVGRVLDTGAASGLAAQEGLGRRTFWQRGLRSVKVGDREAVAAKYDYIHLNPVKAGLCREPTAYRWSSAWMIEAGHATSESGIVLPNRLLDEFGDEQSLSLFGDREGSPYPPPQ